MSSEVPLPPPGFDGLSSAEQIEYVQALWDRIASRPNQVDIPDWHLEILEERLARYGDAVEGRTWEEFENELLEELKKS